MASKSSALDHVVKDAFGEDHDLNQYRGKAVLIVNVASRCGYTSQYKGLQELHKEYSARGLQVLGFPCNQFMGQEPGTDAEIQDFAGQTTALNSRPVEGGSERDQHVPRLSLSDSRQSETFQGKIGWNFEKFLVNKEGNVVGRFNSRIQPKDKRLVDAIESGFAVTDPTQPVIRLPSVLMNVGRGRK